MTMFSHFDIDHWLKVKAERVRQGIVRKTQQGEEVLDHPLKGKTVFDTATNKAYVVESVKKSWFNGWFLMALMNQNGSHRTCVIGNQSCEDIGVLRAYADFSDNFVVQP